MRLEERVLENLGYTLPFYFRYVDIDTDIPVNQIDNILNNFNSFHHRFQFTMEIRGDKLDFLDVTIIKNDNKLELDWFHKSTFSGRHLNFYSQHSFCQKQGTVISMTDRALLLSHSKFQEKNLRFAIDTLLNNDYPSNFIFDITNKRLKSKISFQKTYTK